MPLQRPRGRATAPASTCRLLGVRGTRINVLRSLVIAGFIRGLSVPDVSGVPGGRARPESTVSNATMSRIHPGFHVAGDAGHNVGDAILADPAG